MQLNPIRTKRDYDAALKQADAWWDAPAGSPKAERLDLLSLVIVGYESLHFPIDPPEPVELLEYVMQQRGLVRKDLEPFIGSRARVTELLNRVRPLSLETIRKLSEGLDLPTNVLVRMYEVREAA